MILWSEAESHLALVAANLPSLGPIFRKVFTRDRLTTSHAYGTHGNAVLTGESSAQPLPRGSLKQNGQFQILEDDDYNLALRELRS